MSGGDPVNQAPAAGNGKETVTQTAADLRPERTSDPSALRPRRVTGHGECFVYGGVAFELLGVKAESLDALGDQARACVVRDEASTQRAFARVTCVVREDLPLDPAVAGGREIGWERTDTSLVIKTPLAHTTLSETAPGHWAAVARVATQSGLGAAMTAIATTLAEQAGGLILHSSGIELDGRAVLFIGPSGAGKTTACNHVPSARGFTWDRTAIVPDGDGYRAWALPGGDEIVLKWSDHVTLPLAAVLRVRRGSPEPRIERAGKLDAMVVLRESTQSGVSNEREQVACLDRIARAAAAVPIGFAHTKLDAGLDPMLRAWLAEGSR